MISFIAIGKNEGWKLNRCLESIFLTIKLNSINKFEIIYVDSKSEDNSIEIARKFNKIKIFSIIGKCNAAIARNIGAKEAKGDFFVFIDGDMEIMPSFFPLVFENNRLKYDFVSGNWIDYHYSNKESKVVIRKNIKKNNNSDINEFTCGGLFMIKQSLWLSMEGMKTKFRRSQDWDFCLRLARNNIFLLRKKEILAKHHTVSPIIDTKSLWKLILSGAKYYRAVILRDHIFNIFSWRHFLRINYTFFVLWFLIIFIVLFGYPQVISIYLLLIMLRSLKRKNKNFSYIISSMILFTFYEFTLLISFLFFWPRNKKIKYIKLK